MIRDYFDRLLMMSTKNKAITLVFLLALFFFLSRVEFTEPALPLSQHKGICGSDICFISLFSVWVIAFTLTCKYFFMDPNLDPKTFGFRGVVIENAGMAFFCTLMVLWFGIIRIGFLVTGKFCLFVNQGCLN